MRVAVIGPTYPFRGGIAQHTTLFACATFEAGHTVRLFSFRRQYPRWLYPGKSDKDPSADPITFDGVDYLIDSLNPLTWLRAARAVAAFRPDVVAVAWWVAFWAPPFWVILYHLQRHTSAEVVLLCHNAVEHESKRWKRRLARAVFDQANRIVTHSAEESAALREPLGSHKRITTAFHPTYAPLARERPDRSAARRELALDGPTLLFFGFVRDYKGLDVLLNALPAVRAAAPVTLLVVGEFWKDKARYLAQIEALGLGEVVRIVDRYVPDEEVGRFFTAADLVVQPYRSATGSGVAQLAYGYGKPLVATRVGGLPDVVEHGVSGMLVPPEDPAALAAAILASLEPGRLESMGAGAMKTADRFSWSRYVELVLNREAAVPGPTV